MRRLLWLIGLVSMVVAGCGGSSKPSTTGTTTASASGTTTTKPPSFSGPKDSRYCTLARKLSKDVNFDQTADLRATFQELDSFVGELLSVVPSELKADASIAIGALRQLETALRAVNYDIGKVDRKGLTIFDDPKFTAATDRLDAYDTQVCGIDSTPTT